MNILLVDDDPGIFAGFREILDREDRLIHVPSTDQARIVLVSECPLDCIILDTTESVETTQAFVAEIRRHDRSVGIVIYSGRAHDHRSMKSMGVNAILDKSAPIGDVVDAVRRAAKMAARHIDLQHAETICDEYISECRQFISAVGFTG